MSLQFEFISLFFIICKCLTLFGVSIAFSCTPKIFFINSFIHFKNLRLIFYDFSYFISILSLRYKKNIIIVTVLALQKLIDQHLVKFIIQIIVF